MIPDLVHSILAGMPMPVLIVDRTGRVAAMNAPARAMFGPAGPGRHYIAVLRQPALLDCVEEALRLGQVRRARYLTTDIAREATYEVLASPLGEGGADGVTVAFSDITEREQVGQIRRDFVANVSHELKTPLTALLGFIETLKGPARDDAAARDRFLDIMLREATRMSRLISDLLSLSRVEAEERMRPEAQIDLAATLRGTVQALGTLAQAADVALILEGAEQPILVQGDSDQLTQVMENLIENGIKYGGTGGEVRVVVTQSARELAFRGPGVRVDVIDKGEGFDPVHIPRLTERFYRVDNHRSREMGGTGLGLAIVKHIVNRHRGRFRIDSTPGEGSTFSVMLPRITV
ncbi:ATP-binding protein [Rhodovulum adriaticum]|uniref:histidine kinase n=1 Tax=Rhodovulum adriaticum TaxID=35804 RepID=A0A4R2NNG5_RHOAD|nr:ATP-binding protein [Rhodovulum adriaticum]MBK1634411.1 two-component sensor histidine kinase [Rhodovulum adriaticum]TCP23220.1 two-component system phosphate regulon sensor histidine kinase PhoR [Rhodovulum adriaticum]